MNTTATPNNPAAEAATFTLRAVDSLGNAHIAKAQLTTAQVDELIDTTKRLQSMAILGTPTVPEAAYTGVQIDLALHALLTAYMSLADAFPLHTWRAAGMADRVAVSLQALSAQRAGSFPQQIQ